MPVKGESKYLANEDEMMFGRSQCDFEEANNVAPFTKVLLIKDDEK